MEVKTQVSLLFAALLVILAVAYWYGTITLTGFGTGAVILAVLYALVYWFRLRKPEKVPA